MTDERRRRAARRRAEARSDEPPPTPARRRLAARAGEVDRRARFEARLRDVRRHEERRGRRDRGLRVAGWTGGTVVALVAGYALGGPAGAAAGLAVVALVAAGALAVQRLAARRGARAWDWRAGRHRLLGDPSREVRARDEPRDDSGGRRPGR